MDGAACVVGEGKHVACAGSSEFRLAVDQMFDTNLDIYLSGFPPESQALSPVAKLCSDVLVSASS